MMGHNKAPAVNAEAGDKLVKKPRYWDDGDVYQRIVDALQASGKSTDHLTVEDLAPVDHFHARGFRATRELADRLNIAPGQRILDIGCGVGGPARYFAKRFGCDVDGIDITPAFVDAAIRLTDDLGLSDVVRIQQGDGTDLPYGDASFDGAIALHVTMNIADRQSFFQEVHRVLKPRGFFAITEHGAGYGGDIHYPVPWSSDGTGSYLLPADETHRYLSMTGFENIKIDDRSAEYRVAYQKVTQLIEEDRLPSLGVHLLIGDDAPAMTENSARNVDEKRTSPHEIFCTKQAEDY